MATASYSSIPSSGASSQLKPMILVDAHRGSNRGQYAEDYIDQINELRLEDEVRSVHYLEITLVTLSTSLSLVHNHMLTHLLSASQSSDPPP